MTIEKWKESCRRLWEEMKPMTFKQKAEHIWTYYKEHMFMVAMALLVVAAIIGSTISANREILVSGVLCNVSMSMEGYNYLTEDLFERMDGDSSYQDAYLSPLEFQLPEEMTQSQVDASYISAMSMISMVEGKTLDYAIITQDAFVYFLGHELFLDLREFLTEDEMEQWKGKVVYAQAELEDGSKEEMYPVAIDITDLPFTKDCVRAGNQTVYLTIIVNSPRVEQCRQVWEDILAWQSKEEENAA